MQKSHKELYSVNGEHKPLLNKRLKLLYEGGFDIQEHSDMFLEQIKGLETKASWIERKKCVAYLPYLSEFITQFGASLFSEALEVKAQADASDETTQGEDITDDFYKGFLEQCDLERRTFHKFAQDILEKALSELCVYVTLDFPKGERVNRLQERQEGLDKGYACLVPYDNVIDWKIDPATGKFLWVKEWYEVIPNEDPLVETKHYFEFRIRTMKLNKQGKMCGGWDIWRTKLMKLTEKISDKIMYTKMVDEEVITSFPEINFWKLCINKAYHVGQQIGTVCQEHYQRRSLMVSNSNKTCVALGVAIIGPDVGAPGDTLPPDIEPITDVGSIRKKLVNEGWVVGRKTDKWADEFKIIESEGKSHKFVADDLKQLVESMMQTLRQMNMTATANQKAVGRSAASKREDGHGTSMLLSVYEGIIKDFTKLLFTCLAQGRGEDINFAVEGLSISEPSFNRDTFVKELTAFGVDIMKFPDIWKMKYLNKAAAELIENNMTDKERMEIEEKFTKSIEDGTFDAIDEAEATAAGNKMAKTTASEPGAPSDTSNAQLPTSQADIDPKTVHDRSVSTAGVADTVMKQLKPDYNKNLLSWIPAAHWVQLQVPMDSIDSTNRDNWEASKNQDKVESMAQAMQEGWDKPVILVNEPNGSKMKIVDGHHRFLANEQNGESDISAFVAYVGGIDGPWKDMHDLQKDSEEDTLKSQQKSNQTKN